MLYEMKKFYKNSAIIILLVLGILLSIAMPVFFIHDYESYDYSTGKEVAIKGLDGLRLRKEQVKKTTGVLSTEKLDDALALYKSLPAGDEAYFKVEEDYPELFRFLKEAYLPYAGGNEFLLVGSIPNADDFYDRNVEQVKGKIIAYGETTYLSDDETQEVLKRASVIEKPFKYEFFDQWPILIKSLIFVYPVLAFSAILISNQLFSFEKEKNMDIILNSVGRKKLIGIGYKKILAMVCYLTFEFLLCSIIVSSIVFGLVGVTGWNSQIQIMPEFFTMVYNWSLGQMFICFMIIAWICILSIALIGAFINSVFQKTYASLIMSVLLIVPPIFLKSSSFLPVPVRKFLCTQSINGINLLSFIDSLFSYKIGPYRVLNSSIIVVFAGVYFIICMLLAPILFTKRINK